MATRVVHLTSLHIALDTRIFHKECRTLADAGYDVHLVVHDPPVDTRDGVTFHAIPRATGSKWTRAVERLRKTYRIARSLEGAVYHFHDPELIPVGIALKRSGAKVIYDAHENAPVQAITSLRFRPVDARILSASYTVYERLAARLLDGFIMAWPGLEERFPRDKRIVIANYPRLDEFKALNASAEPGQAERRAMYVGGISRVRGLFEILDALALFGPDEPLRLDLLGRFIPSELLAEAERHPGWAHVDYRGWCSRDEIVRYMAKCRMGLVLLHPEPHHLVAEPTKLYEYMAAGLPAIASDFPLYQRIMEDARCGLLIDPLDPHAIADAIRWMLNHPEEARAMGERGRRKVQEKYNWDVEGRRLVAFYRFLGIEPN